MGQIIAMVLGVCAVFTLGGAGLSGTGLRYAVGIFFFLSVPVIAFASEEIGKCPTCGKSPRLRAKGNMSWFELYFMKRRYRWWPERQCSECGTALDIRP